MTERLYYVDSYLRRFEAGVVDHDAPSRRVYLDQTAFYPTSGGQQFDVGSLQLAGTDAPLAIVDVLDEGERIAHVLAAGSPEPAPGARVVGLIDWSRRFDHMQQHTGQHLLSALFQELLGLGTLSVHFGEESSTLDLDAAALGTEQMLSVEQRANTAVFENREVSATQEDAAQAAAGLRKASTRTGALRIVSIAGLDRSACGGTHVQRTGEIGPILLRKLERVRQSVRIEFLCGGRATRRARADYAVLSELGGLLSTSIDELPAVVSSRITELQQQGKQLRDLQLELDELRGRERYARAKAGAAEGALVLYQERLPTGSLQGLRGLAQRYAAQPRAVFIAVLEQPASLLIATAEDSGVDAAARLKSALTTHGGRGGGTPRLAQGSAPSVGALEAALGELLAQLGLAPSTESNVQSQPG
jgi:alanyl-tRNA synthetase